MDNLDFLKPTETAARTLDAVTLDAAKMAAVTIIKEMAQGAITSPRFIEPLCEDAAQPPHVRAMDENGDILQVNIKELAAEQYELQFTRYTIDDEKLQRSARR